MSDSLHALDHANVFGTGSTPLQANPPHPLTGSPSSERVSSQSDQFLPREPETLHESGLKQVEVEALVTKFLSASGSASGRKIASHLHLSFGLIQELLRCLKLELLVTYKREAPMNDYEYELTAEGHQRARRHAERNSYFGSAPVPFESYLHSVEVQSIRRKAPRMDALRRAFRDLVLPESIIKRIGQALNSGRGLFLFGSPGNGKSSLAERITNSVDDPIWIPRAISTTGEIIRLYDPNSHVELPLDEEEEAQLAAQDFRVDRRWVRIVRPTIIVGGELTIDQLELHHETNTGISEAPLHMKSNGGTLVVDDFGRQRCRTDELLNRWIVPVEKGFDYLRLNSGRQLQVPFDQFLVFATNLAPRDLIDEAFMRRIPYKIELPSPSKDHMREIFRRAAATLQVEYCEDTIEQLLDKHYSAGGHPLRGCLGRDLLEQVKDYCEFNDLPLKMTLQNLDIAVENYYADL